MFLSLPSLGCCVLLIGSSRHSWHCWAQSRKNNRWMDGCLCCRRWFMCAPVFLENDSNQSLMDFRLSNHIYCQHLSALYRRFLSLSIISHNLILNPTRHQISKILLYVSYMLVTMHLILCVSFDKVTELDKEIHSLRELSCKGHEFIILD